MLHIFNIPMCEDCFNDAENFGFVTLYILAISIIILLLLAFGQWWTGGPPINPETVIIAFATIALSCASAAGLAIECAYQGYLAATAGDYNHAHVADILRRYGNALCYRLTYWLAYSLWLVRLMVWYLRRVLPRD